MRELNKRGVLGGLLLLAGLGGHGCSDEETGLYIKGVMVVQAPQCIVRPDSSAPLELGGQLDVARRSTYTATLLVGNQLTPRGDKQNLRTETMVTTITGAVVRLFDDVGQPITEFTVPASGVIDPDDGSEASLNAVDVTLVPASVGLQFASDFPPNTGGKRVANVSVFGKTLGGLEVESSEFTYVIDVCNGCFACLPDEVMTGCRLGQDEFTCEDIEN
jgi:hypothetical protein